MILRELIDGIVCASDADPVFEEKYELIVVGLGTAGAISLITAGREGISVLGIEQLGEMGGTGTSGSVCYYYFGAEGGLYTEIDDKAMMLRSGIFHDSNKRDTNSLVLEREARACGAGIKYHCIVTGVYMDDDKVMGLRLFQNGRETAVCAEKFIDATGEAHICHIAGGESSYGRAFDGRTQPATSVSILADKNGKVSATNKDAGFVDSRDPREVSRTIIHSNTFPMYLKDDYSGEGGKFIAVAPLFGVREGRLIKGKKQLQMKDIVNRNKKAEKPLFYTFSNLDNHGKDIAFEDEDMCDWMVAAGLWGVLMSVPVTIGTLIPEKLENIMVAGRCLAATHNMAAGIRMKRDMHKCGEAAAYVCCEAIKKSISLSEVEYDNIVDKLKERKCLNEENNIGFMERVANRYFGNPLPELNTADEIIECLSGEKPGWAIWAAKMIAVRADQAEEENSAKLFAEKKRELVTELKACLDCHNENLSRNAALALGIIKEQCAVNKLREMAKEPDNYVPKSSLKYIYTRGVSAIYLLGRLGDKGAADILLDIVERGGRTKLTDFEFGEFYHAAEDVFSQYVLFSVRALISIAKANPEEREHIRETLQRYLEEPEYEVMVTLRDNSVSLCDLKPKLAEYVKRNL